jgi:predicted HTH domain antitoxin
MTIEIADEILSSPSPGKEILLEVALYLFANDKVSLGKAAEIAGIPKMQMQYEAGSRKIPMHYDEEMAMEDVEAIKKYRANAGSK